MKKKSLKVCLKNSFEISKLEINKNHFEVIKPIINDVLNHISVEEIDDLEIIRIENDIIMDYFDKIIEERKAKINKLASKKKFKEVEIESNELAIISYYYIDCCNYISH